MKLGNNEFYGVNYLQSVTPHLALGGEAFWLGQQRKSGAGFAARHADAAHVATCQLATTGLVSLTYLQKVSEKVRGARVRGAVHAAPACLRTPLLLDWEEGVKVCRLVRLFLLL